LADDPLTAVTVSAPAPPLSLLVTFPLEVLGEAPAVMLTLSSLALSGVLGSPSSWPRLWKSQNEMITSYYDSEMTGAQDGSRTPH